MAISIESPSALELDQLSSMIETQPLDRKTLIAQLRRIEGELRERRRELDRDGGLLDVEEQSNRMSLTREDERLRGELSSLADDVQWAKLEAEGSAENDQVRDRVQGLVVRMQHHRDSEAKLVVESTTEVGAGD